MNARLHEWTDEEKREYLDDTCRECRVGSLTFPASEVVENLDPVAFDSIMDAAEDLWECGKCGATYDDEDAAEECCREEDD